MQPRSVRTEESDLQVHHRGTAAEAAVSLSLSLSVSLSEAGQVRHAAEATELRRVQADSDAVSQGSGRSVRAARKSVLQPGSQARQPVPGAQPLSAQVLLQATPSLQSVPGAVETVETGEQLLL